VSEDALTSPGTAVGTVAYMSPEQARGEDLDARTDLFSFGVALYEMATGSLPFKGSTSAVIFKEILTKGLTSPVRLRPELPGEFEHILRRALEKDRALRCQSAKDLLTELKRLKRDTDSGRTSLRGATPEPVQKLHLPRWWPGLVFLLLILSVPVWWYLLVREPRVPERPLQITPFTAMKGWEGGPSISPDGNRIAFHWDGNDQDNWDIYVRQIGPGKPLRVTKHPAQDCCPISSPDGRQLAFGRIASEIESSLFLIPSLGGAERKIMDCRVPRGTGTCFWLGSWSSDGRSMVISLQPADEYSTKVFLLSMDSFTTTPLTSPPTDSVGDWYPKFSPDDQRVAFFRVLEWEIADVWVQPLASGKAERLTFENYATLGGPAWTGEGKEIVFSASKTVGRPRLWRVSSRGGQPELVHGIGEHTHEPTISRLGDTLAYSQRTPSATDIWRMPGPNSSK